MTKGVTIVLRVPDWANWVAQNREGDWWVFAGEPQLDNTHERWHHEPHDINRACMRVAIEVGPIEDWKDSREPVK